HRIADLHLVPHVVARLVVAHARPRLDPARTLREILDGKVVGFGFHEPVFHGGPSGVGCREKARSGSKLIPFRKISGFPRVRNTEMLMKQASRSRHGESHPRRSRMPRYPSPDPRPPTPDPR